jgi:hypothetical protein
VRLLKEKTSRVEIDIKKGGEKAGEGGKIKEEEGGGGGGGLGGRGGGGGRGGMTPPGVCVLV